MHIFPIHEQYITACFTSFYLLLFLRVSFVSFSNSIFNPFSLAVLLWNIAVLTLLVLLPVLLLAVLLPVLLVIAAEIVLARVLLPILAIVAPVLARGFSVRKRLVRRVGQYGFRFVGLGISLGVGFGTSLGVGDIAVCVRV